MFSRNAWRSKPEKSYRDSGRKIFFLFASSEHMKYIYPTIFNAQIAGSRINLSSEFRDRSGGNVCISLYNQIAREQRMKYRASTWRVIPGIPSTSSLPFFPPFLPLFVFKLSFRCRESVDRAAPSRDRFHVAPPLGPYTSSLSPHPSRPPPSGLRRHANRIKPE